MAIILIFSERVETTEYAKEKINSFIDNGEFHLALLIAHIYASIRLSSLLTDYKIKPKKGSLKDSEWKKEAKKLKKNLHFSTLLKNCKNGLIRNNEFTALTDLNKRRNEVAHESRLWKDNIQESEKNDIKALCKSVMKFLEDTNEKRHYDKR
jgi:hypothetical protein